jgi:hypothetical protein
MADDQPSARIIARRSLWAVTVIGLEAVPFLAPDAQFIDGIPVVRRSYWPSRRIRVSPGRSRGIAKANVLHGDPCVPGFPLSPVGER